MLKLLCFQQSRLIFYYLSFVFLFMQNVYSQSIEVEGTLIPLVNGQGQALDLREAVNSSMFDDGIADNQQGGWTDEGSNDFYQYPAITFGQNLYRGYAFDVIDPKHNQNQNLVLIGHDQTWSNLPTKLTIKGLSKKAKHLFKAISCFLADN